MIERTVVLIKPDGVKRKLIGEIIKRLEAKDLKLGALKMIQLTDEILDVWYAHHRDKSFFDELEKYMKLLPVVAMIWEGEEAISVIRNLCGVTNSRQALPGTIRGDLSMSVQQNLIHASDSSEAAQKEINLLFQKEEIFNY